MKIGAQRLYKAVKSNDTSTTILFLTSESKGEFKFQKVFEQWIAGGKNPEMLDAILQYEPMRQWSTRGRIRRGKKNFENEEFRLPIKVLNLMETETNYTKIDPSTDTLSWLKDITQILVAYDGDQHLNTCNFTSNLRTAVGADKEWPWYIAAVSRGIGFDLATYSYKTEKQRHEAIDWFLDMHGPVTEQDFEHYTGDLARMMEEHRYQELARLVSDTETLKKLLARDDYRFVNKVRNLIQQHHRYTQLLQIAPWIAEEGVSDED